MMSSEQKQEVNDLKSRVTDEQLAYCLEQELGEKVSRTGKDWRVGKRKAARRRNNGGIGHELNRITRP